MLTSQQIEGLKEDAVLLSNKNRDWRRLWWKKNRKYLDGMTFGDIMKHPDIKKFKPIIG